MIRLLEFDEQISREEFSRLQRKISSAYDSFYRLPDDVRYKFIGCQETARLVLAVKPVLSKICA